MAHELETVIGQHAPLIREILQTGRERAAMSINSKGQSGKPYPDRDQEWMIAAVARQIMEFGPEAVLNAWKHTDLDWGQGRPEKPLNWLCSHRMMEKFVESAAVDDGGANPYRQPVKPTGKLTINAPPGTLVRSRNSVTGVVIEITLERARDNMDEDDF